MQSYTSHWSITDMTPRLLQAVGKAIVYWAMLEADVYQRAAFVAMVHGATVPFKFTEQLDQICDYGGTLYPRHPDMPDKLRAFVAALKDDAALRNDISHGTPRWIEVGGKKFFGLHVPPLGRRDTRLRPLSVEDLESAADRFQRRVSEFGNWGYELSLARERIDRSSREMRDGKWCVTADLYPDPLPNLATR